jgi:hypothetical protein
MELLTRKGDRVALADHWVQTRVGCWVGQVPEKKSAHKTKVKKNVSCSFERGTASTWCADAGARNGWGWGRVGLSGTEKKNSVSPPKIIIIKS